jgi:hypothetical protein
MATVVAAMSGVPFQQLVATTTGTGTVLAIPMSFRNHTWIITGAAGITAGSVQIETGTDPTLDTGTWAAVGAAVTPLASTDLLVQATGIFEFLRARVATTISGGGAPSVTVTYLGGKSF